MSHQFKPSEMRRFYRSINDVFTSFESLETIDAGFALTFPATDRWRRTLEGFPREFVERFPAYEASVDGLPDGRLRLHLRGGSESLKFLERVMQGAQAGALELPSRLVSAFRRATVPLRLSPEVLVIGAPRSGTTTLFSLLCDHPRMLGPATKELGFFDISYGRGLSHYRSLFPFRFKRARDGSRNSAFTGEATPTYLANPVVPARVHAAFPDMKLIAMIRNPIDRAFSQYQWGIRNGVERLSFEEALDREAERLAGEFERMTADVDHFSAGWVYHSYLTTGHYAEHLERWTASFSREQLLIVDLESFAAAPGGELRRVVEFLELPRWEPAEFAQRNAFSYSELQPQTRLRLEEYFRPHNERLWDFLGTDLGWNQPATTATSSATSAKGEASR